MGLMVMKCPSCGAELNVDDTKNTFFCTYCGTRIENVAQRYEINQNVNVNQNVNMNVTMDHSNEPNLIIQYSSVHPGVYMVVRIVATGQKLTYMNGQSFSYHLTPGWHQIILKIGKKNYSRNVFIIPERGPVRIYGAYTGRAEINIDQPPYDNSDVVRYSPNLAMGNAQAVNAAPGMKMSGFAIAGFVLALTFYLSPLGLIFGIVDLATKKTEAQSRRRHGLAIPAVIIGGIGTIFLISFLATVIAGS